MMSKETLEQALEAFTIVRFCVPPAQRPTIERAITSVIEALAKQEQGVDWKDMYEKEKRRSEMWISKYEKDIGPLERATPQQEQGEPVAGTKTWFEDGKVVTQNLYYSDVYITSQQRNPLTDEQISDLWCKTSNTDFVTADTHVFAKAIEAAHGIAPQGSDK